MKSSLFVNILYKLAALFLGVVFLWAACSKCADLAVFHTTVRKLNLFPQWFIMLIVLFVPGIEMILGLCFLSGTVVRDAALLSSFMLAVFVVLAIHRAFNGNLTSCGCFGTSKFPFFQNFTGWWIVSRDLIFFGCSIFLFLFDSQHSRAMGRA